MYTSFSQLQIGDYFRIPGISTEYVYRKANSVECSLGAVLQPIRQDTEVIALNSKETSEYFREKFTAKQKFFESIRK
jgi:hypothetical protein